MLVPEASIVDLGLSPTRFASRQTAFGSALAALRGTGVHPGDMLAFFVPGRIEVLGKHTDYAGGRSLLCTAEQGFCVVARPRRDATVTVMDAATMEVVQTSLAAPAEPTRGHWSNYPQTVVRRIARNFPDVRVGADIAFASDLPPAAGLSTSSAFMIGVFLVVAHLNRLDINPRFATAISNPEALAGYLATVENGRSFGTLGGDRGVGTFGGSEDHTAILCCRRGTFSQYRFGPAACERSVVVPAGHTLVVAASGIVAEKTGSALEAYNRAARSAARALELWRQQTGREDPTLSAAVTSGPGARLRMHRLLEAADVEHSGETALWARVEQFCVESLDVIPAAGDALAAGDLTRFGVLVDRSQDAVERWLGNQVPETITLARTARDGGAVAASAFGAGFGGSVWAMVRADCVEGFRQWWAQRYQTMHPAAAARASFFETNPGSPAVRLDPAELGIC